MYMFLPLKLIKKRVNFTFTYIELKSEVGTKKRLYLLSWCVTYTYFIVHHNRKFCHTDILLIRPEGYPTERLVGKVPPIGWDIYPVSTKIYNFAHHISFQTIKIARSFTV